MLYDGKGKIINYYLQDFAKNAYIAQCILSSGNIDVLSIGQKIEIIVLLHYRDLITT